MNRQRGQALVEYAVCTGLLAAALFVPVIDGQSVATAIAHALARSFRAFSALIALA